MIRPHSYDSYCGCRMCCQQGLRDEEADELAVNLHGNGSVLMEAAGEFSNETWAQAAKLLADNDDLALAELIRRQVDRYIADQTDECMAETGLGRLGAVQRLMDRYEVKARKPQGTPELPWRAVA